MCVLQARCRQLYRRFLRQPRSFESSCRVGPATEPVRAHSLLAQGGQEGALHHGGALALQAGAAGATAAGGGDAAAADDASARAGIEGVIYYSFLLAFYHFCLLTNVFYMFFLDLCPRGPPAGEAAATAAPSAGATAAAAAAAAAGEPDGGAVRIRRPVPRAPAAVLPRRDLFNRV